jgi:hypothetical protein
VATKYRGEKKMERTMKNRLALLSILLIAGLLMAGIGTALGAGKVLQGKPSAFSAHVDQSGNVIIEQDGKVVQNFTLPEGENYTWKASSGGIQIHKMTKEEIEKEQTQHETELNKLLEIARKDRQVQELIDGKDYKVVGSGGSGQTGNYGKIVSSIMLDVEGKYYKVTIDSTSEAVISIEEQNSK